MDPGITPDGRSRDLHRGPKVWGMGSGVTQMHGTWSTAYAYAVPMRAGTHIQTTSSAARGDVECREIRDLGSWDLGQWDRDP